LYYVIAVPLDLCRFILALIVFEVIYMTVYIIYAYEISLPKNTFLQMSIGSFNWQYINT